MFVLTGDCPPSTGVQDLFLRELESFAEVCNAGRAFRHFRHIACGLADVFLDRGGARPTLPDARAGDVPPETGDISGPAFSGVVHDEVLMDRPRAASRSRRPAS